MDRSGPARLARPLRDGLTEIGARVAAAKRVAILLDFDGTLAAIAPRPELAHMEPCMRAALLQLCAMPTVLVAIVSGRELEDLRDRVGIPGLVYAGCHGLVIDGRGMHFVEARAGRERLALRLLAEQLEVRLERVAGVLVEAKDLGISVHFRQAGQVARRTVAEAVCTLADQWGDRFRLRRGKEVWEIAPAVDWNKGHAVRWILDHAAGPNSLPICIGDDVTDEDAFLALPEGITVKVGDAAGSCAAWSVSGPGEVGAFLMWLRSRVA